MKGVGGKRKSKFCFNQRGRGIKTRLTKYLPVFGSGREGKVELGWAVGFLTGRLMGFEELDESNKGSGV